MEFGEGRCGANLPELMGSLGEEGDILLQVGNASALVLELSVFGFQQSLFDGKSFLRGVNTLLKNAEVLGLLL
jgi:hypothetical protein